MSQIKSVFGAYAEQLQVVVDTNLEAFETPAYPRFLDMGLPQMGLTYATAVGKSRIEGAASVVAHGSESPLRSRPTLDKYTGEVAAIKVKRKMKEDDYRNWLTIQGMNVSDEAKLNMIIRLIWEDVKMVTNSVNSRIDYMLGQALSTGVISLNTTTNPDGVVPGDIDLLVSNKMAADEALGTDAANRLWTDALKATATPITDIQYLTRLAWKTYGVRLGKMIMTPEKFWILQNNTQVQNYLKATFGIQSGNFQPSLANINGFLASQSLPIIELFDVRTAVEKSGVITAVDAWNDKKYVAFVPDGKLGVLHNALAIEQISPVANVSYALANNILISKWSQTEPFGEFTRGEIAAFPGLEVAESMFIVNTEDRTTF